MSKGPVLSAFPSGTGLYSKNIIIGAGLPVFFISTLKKLKVVIENHRT